MDQLMAQRGDSPRAQLEARRAAGRHAELRRAPATGLWDIWLLAGGDSPDAAAQVAGLLCASADLDGPPLRAGPRARRRPPRAGPRRPRAAGAARPGPARHGNGLLRDVMAMQPAPSPGPGSPAAGPVPAPQRAEAEAGDGDPVPEFPRRGVDPAAGRAGPAAGREIPGSRFVLRPEFDTIPETGTEPSRPGRGVVLGHLLDRDRLPAGALSVSRSIAEPAHVRVRGHRGGQVPDGPAPAGAGHPGGDPVAGDRARQGRVQQRMAARLPGGRGHPDPAR